MGEGLVAGAACPGKVLSFMESIFEVYGLTETSPITTMNVPEQRQVGSFGHPIGVVVLYVVDEDGQPVLQGHAQYHAWIIGIPKRPTMSFLLHPAVRAPCSIPVIWAKWMRVVLSRLLVVTRNNTSWRMASMLRTYRLEVSQISR